MITKLRCNNIKLPIETGRWPNTPREERIFHLCNVGLGTEFHFLFECTSADVQRLRCKFIPIIRSSLGVFGHLPVSIGSLMLLHLSFVIMFLSCDNNFNKYLSKLNSI
jgi:hypothetical protein